MNRKHGKSRRGAALALVLMFMTLMVVLGTALIAASQYGALQSISLVKADKHYYAAESGAQLAAQIFLSKFGPDAAGYYLEEENIPASVNIGDYIESMKGQLLARIGGYHTDMSAQIAARQFNSETVTISSDFGITIDDVGSDYGEAVGGHGIKTYTAVVYLDNPKFIVSATSGGRTVTLETNADVSASVTSATTGLSPSELTGVFYDGNNGGVYADDDGTVYAKYKEALENLLADAQAKYSSHTGGTGIIPDGILPARHAFNPADTNARYINSWNTVRLGKPGETTVYPNLEYIRSESGLEVAGNVELPALKGINVISGNSKITGTINFPVLENFYSGGELIIEANAKINPDCKPSGECNFYGGAFLRITCSAVINWCRFYYQGIVIDYKTGGKLTSNSIFYPRNHMEFLGKASGDTSGVIPQFYMPSSLWPHISTNIGTFAGIFMMQGNYPVVADGHGFAGETTLIGLFVGNFNTHSSEPVDNATVKEFDPDDLALMMGGGLGSYLTGAEGSYVSETTVVYEYKFTGLNLRETTGEE